MDHIDWTLLFEKCFLGFRMIGLWPPLKKANLQFFYAMVYFTSTLFHVVCQTIIIFFIYSNTKVLTAMLYLSFEESMTMIKVCTFIKNYKDLQHLLMFLNDDTFQPKEMRQIKLIEPDLKTFRLLYTAYRISISLTVIALLTLPFITGQVKYKELPFLVWYPFEVNNSPNYEIVYVHQVLSLTYLLIFSFNFDCFIAGLMMCVGFQCDILCDSLRNLGKGHTDNGSFAEDLTLAVKHYKKIFKFYRECNDFLQFIILIQFFTSVLSLASSLFNLSLVSGLEIWFNVATVATVLMQTFVFEWYGNEIIVKSDRISYAIFESDWIATSQEVKRILLIFMMNTMKPIKISSFGIFDLTLQTFMKIIRSAWSYFAIFNQLDS